MTKFKFISKKEIEKLPKANGVYCFRNKKKVLYIGKAANIKERVKNHFSPRRSFSERGSANFKDNLFIDKVLKIGFLETGSEIEALILEANLIKRCQPKYNVAWRDDKNYFFVAITVEDFPRLYITHQPRLKIDNWKLKINYIGPFVDGTSLKQTLKILRKAFPYRSCKIMPKRPCLWYQLNRCPAPCALFSNLGNQIPTAKNNLKKDYIKNINSIVKILKGKKSEVLNNLEKEMKFFSKQNNFEKAAKSRNRISALKKILAHTRLNFADKNYGGQAKIFESDLNLPENDWLKTQIIIREIFHIKNCSRIEGYDISNIQGKEAAGAMITFIDGKPNKSFYRKFGIKVGNEPNDTAMIKEILTRRLKHKEWPYPDLILIDGGKPQLSVAISSVKSGIPAYRQTGKNIKIIAIAKRNNELFVEDRKNPILLKKLPREIFNLILQIRDEAHRFAHKYHLYLRKEQFKKN